MFSSVVTMPLISTSPDSDKEASHMTEGIHLPRENSQQFDCERVKVTF